MCFEHLFLTTKDYGYFNVELGDLKFNSFTNVELFVIFVTYISTCDHFSKSSRIADLCTVCCYTLQESSVFKALLPSWWNGDKFTVF